MATGRTSGPLLAGLTGGIGSGKSTVAGLFRELGRTVFSADEIARELTETDAGVRKKIRSAFGTGVFTAEGALDRKALAGLVFNDPEALARLNGIVHPAVFTRLDQLISALPPGRAEPFVLVEAALVYESGMDARLDYVVVVHAAEDARVRRVMQRDRVSREEVLARIRSQMPAAEKLDLADFVIHNDGAPESLRGAVALIDSLLARIAATPTP